jgi:hypothetical protein
MNPRLLMEQVNLSSRLFIGAGVRIARRFQFQRGNMKKILFILTALVCSSYIFASDLVITNNLLTESDPLFDRVDESGALDPAGMGVNYHTLSFYVTQSGAYDVEMGVLTSNDPADTFLLVYAPGLNPSDATQSFLAGNDDSADALNVLSGSYRSGSAGRSALHGLFLTANTQYQAVLTTWWFVDTFFDEVTYDVGIGNGQGDVIAGSAPVPEPATLTILGIATLGLLRARRK